MSADLSFILFCESIVGCQIAVDKMTLRPDLRITDSDVLRKFIRGLTVVGHKSSTECDSMDVEYVKLYSRYTAYVGCADPAVHADHVVFSSKHRLFAGIRTIHTRWSLSCPRNKVPPATWVAMAPDLMAPTGHVMHLSDDDMVLSLSTMDGASFDHIFAVCDNSVGGYAPPGDTRAHCDAVLALAPDDFDSLLMARDFRISPTSSPSATAPLLEARQLLVLVEACLVVIVIVVLLVAVLSDVGQALRLKAVMLRWLRISRPIELHKITDRMLTTMLPTLPTVVKQRSAKSMTTCVSLVNVSVLTKGDRNAQHPQAFGKTTMFAPTARKAGQQIYSNVRLCLSLAQRGSNDPAQSAMLCGRIAKALGELYVSVGDMGASEIAPDAVPTVDDDEPAEVTADFLHVAVDKLDTSLTDEHKLPVLKIAGSIKFGAITCSLTTDQSTSCTLSSRMSSALKKSPMKSMAPFFSLESRFTNPSAKCLTPERRKMLNRTVPCLSFTFHWKCRFP